jgi:hypothetical protein
VVGLSLCARRAATFSPGGNEGEISEILDRVIALLRRSLVRIPLDQLPLGRQFSAELSGLRESWKIQFQTPEEIAEVQKSFSDGSVDFVFDLLQESARLLGEPPGNFALLLLGSSSRQDRVPFSDIELALLYSADSENILRMRVYAYILMSILDFLVLNLREDNIGGSGRHGFYIDASEHLLLFPNTFMGTPNEIYERNVLNPWTKSPWFLVLFEDMEGKAEIFTSFLSVVLVNKNFWGGDGLISEFKSKIENFLDSKSDEWTRETLNSAFIYESSGDFSKTFRPPPVGNRRVSTPEDSENSFSELRNRQLVALYCWMDILRKAVDLSQKIPKAFSVKAACHKPLAYLALNLRLFLDTRAVCAIEIFRESSEKGILPFAVTKLLQEMYFFSVSWRSRLHLQNGFQEEVVDLSEITPEDQWAFLIIGEVLHKPLLEALKKILISDEGNYSESPSWDFILREIFNSVWIHYCSKRDGWREIFPEHRLISQFDIFPTPSGIRPAIEAWRKKKKKTLRAFLLPRGDKIFSGSPSPLVEVSHLSPEGNLVTSRLHPGAALELQKKGFLSKSGELVFSQEQVEKEKGRHLVMPVSLETSESSETPETSETSEASKNIETLTLYIKVFPEMPVLEIAATEFATHLIGPCLPWISLVKISVGGKIFPALLSEGIPGELISKNHPPSVDPYFFSLRVLLAVLLNQEDAKPSNFVCMPSLQLPGSFVLVSVDNDRSFYPALHVDKENNILTPQVKDITFCFDEMNSPVSPLAREIFLTLEPYLFLANWLRISKSETLGLETTLFSASEKKTFFPQSGISRQMSKLGRFFTQVAVAEESVLNLLLPSGLIGVLYSKMMKLRQILISNPKSTHSELLCAAEPHLAKYCRKILTFPGTPYERFYRGFGYLYGSKAGEDCVTVSTTFRTLETLHGKTVSPESIENGGEQIESCVAELEGIHRQEVLWRSVLAGFRSNPETFKISHQLFKSFPPELQERVINNLDFSFILTRASEVSLLQDLVTKTEMRNIRFRNSEKLTEELLQRLIGTARELQGLSVVGCAGISPKIFDYIPLSPNLEKLFLSNAECTDIAVSGTQLPKLNFWKFAIPDVVDDPWMNLKVLVLKNFPHLRSLNLPLTGLEVLHFFNCPGLKQIWLRNLESLRSLTLIGCPSVDLPVYHNFLQNGKNLEKLGLPNLRILNVLRKTWPRPSQFFFPEIVSRLNLLPHFSTLSTPEKSELLKVYLECYADREYSENLEVSLFTAQHSCAKIFKLVPEILEMLAKQDLRSLQNGFGQLLKSPENFDITDGHTFVAYRKTLRQIFESSADRDTVISLATEFAEFGIFLSETERAEIFDTIVSNLLVIFGGVARNYGGSQILPGYAFAEVCAFPSLPFPSLPFPSLPFLIFCSSSCQSCLRRFKNKIFNLNISPSLRSILKYLKRRWKLFPQS